VRNVLVAAVCALVTTVSSAIGVPRARAHVDPSTVTLRPSAGLENLAQKVVRVLAWRDEVTPVLGSTLPPGPAVLSELSAGDVALIPQARELRLVMGTGAGHVESRVPHLPAGHEGARVLAMAIEALWDRAREHVAARSRLETRHSAEHALSVESGLFSYASDNCEGRQSRAASELEAVVSECESLTGLFVILDSVYSVAQFVADDALAVWSAGQRDQSSVSQPWSSEPSSERRESCAPSLIKKIYACRVEDLAVGRKSSSGQTTKDSKVDDV